MRKTYRVEITAVAVHDILETRAHIARDKPAAAANWIRELKRKIRSLKTMPVRHEIIPEGPLLGVDYRHIVLGKYRLIDRIQEERVIVLRVIHGARLLSLSMLRG